MTQPTRSAAELLRAIAAADPEAHNRALARGYGVGPDIYEEPVCGCVEAGQPVYDEVGVMHRADCEWFKWFSNSGGCMGDV